MSVRLFLACLALGIAAAVALPYAVRAGEFEDCDEFAKKRAVLASENRTIKCLPTDDIYDPGPAADFNSCMKVGSALFNSVNKMIEDRLAECRLAIAKEKGELEPGPRVSDILEGTKTTGSNPTATVNNDVDVYAEPGGKGEPFEEFLRKDGKVTVLASQPVCDKDHHTNEWCHVQGTAVPHGSGWVWGSFLDF